jgi:hypothetical protein
MFATALGPPEGSPTVLLAARALGKGDAVAGKARVTPANAGQTKRESGSDVTFYQFALAKW